MYGKIFTEEHRMKISQATKGKSKTYTTSTMRSHKKVEQYTIDGKFMMSYDSIKEAADDTKTDSPTITNCCKGNRKTAGGFIWKYSIIYVINQYDLKGKFIKSFENIQMAAKGTDGVPRNIGMCCNGKSNTSNGFIWKREVKN
jgi:hypothetical protein